MVGSGRVSGVFCGTGAAGTSWPQAAMVSAPNKAAAVVSLTFEVKRANGIYSSPLVKDQFIKTLQQKDLVVT
jgi:hypothetical protein